MAWNTSTWGMDDSPWAYLRNYCSCPHCGMMWAHYETSRVKADWQWAKKRYGSQTRCETCGQWSSLRDHWLKGPIRRKIPAPQPQAPSTPKPPESSAPAWWHRTTRSKMPPAQTSTKDHEQEMEP